jgi:hypothetical protein
METNFTAHDFFGFLHEMKIKTQEVCNALNTLDDYKNFIMKARDNFQLDSRGLSGGKNGEDGNLDLEIDDSENYTEIDISEIDFTCRDKNPTVLQTKDKKFDKKQFCRTNQNKISPGELQPVDDDIERTASSSFPKNDKNQQSKSKEEKTPHESEITELLTKGDMGTREMREIFYSRGYTFNSQSFSVKLNYLKGKSIIGRTNSQQGSAWYIVDKNKLNTSKL